MDLLMNLSSKTELPWTPRYTQKSDKVPSDDPLEYWALALTITFTVLVYAFEGYLDGRQKRAYQVTTFPSQLSTTVTKIDAQHDGQTALLPQLQEKFSSSQNYGLDKISFAMISSAYDTFETILFLLLGFLPYTWDKSVDLSHQYFGRQVQGIAIDVCDWRSLCCSPFKNYQMGWHPLLSLCMGIHVSIFRYHDDSCSSAHHAHV